MVLIQVGGGAAYGPGSFCVLIYVLFVFYPVASSCWVICKSLTFQEFSSVGVGRGWRVEEGAGC